MLRNIPFTALASHSRPKVRRPKWSLHNARIRYSPSPLLLDTRGRGRRLPAQGGLEDTLPVLIVVSLDLAAVQWSFSTSTIVSTAAVSGGHLVRLALLGIAIALSFLSILYYNLPASLPFAMWCLIAISSLNFASALWSVYGAVTLFKSLEFAVSLIAALALLSFARRQGAHRVAMRILDTYYIIIFAKNLVVWLNVILGVAKLNYSYPFLPFTIAQVYYPPTSANGVGDLGATLLALSVARRVLLADRALVVKFGMILGVLSLAFGYSRSPMLVGALAILVLAGSRVGLNTPAFVGAAVAGVGIPIALALGLVPVETLAETRLGAMLARGQSVGLLSNLSGRVDWWHAAVTILEGEPLRAWFGYGAYAGSRFVLGEVIESAASSIHNAYFEAWLGIGWLGAGLLVLASGWCVVKGMRAGHAWSGLSGQSRFIIFCFQMFTVLLIVRSIFSVAGYWPPTLIWGLLFVMAAHIQKVNPSHARARRKESFAKSSSRP